MSEIFKDFDVEIVEISGKNLVEASAGTGKTYSIATLFTRAVIEGEGIPVDKILVVTFTKAATEELNERILKSLKEKLAKIQKDNGNSETAERLKRAIDNFDRVSVSTIHSFCSKMIKDFAFESGCSFDLEKTGDSAEIARRAVIDFFRNSANDYPDLFKKDWFNVDELTKIAKRHLANPLLKLRTSGQADTPDASELFFSHFFEFIDKTVQSYRSGGLLGFDDQIAILYETLTKSDDSAEALAKAVRERYKLVFIDEFQDTDPVQTEIFSRLFDDPGHTVFYIGDPKQSIYSFRNADIYAYLKVSKNQRDLKKYKMGVNYRSSAKAVEAVNRLFAPQGVFQISQLEYQSVDHNKTDKLVLGNGDEYGIEICDVTPENGKSLTKKEAEKTIFADMISRIREMVRPDSPCRIIEDGAERPVKYSDFAVIVRANKSAEKIKNELGKYGIPSVLRSKKVIFDTVEAKDLLILLDAAANPDDRRKRRAVELTIFRASSSDDAGTNRDFNDFCENWREHGLFSAFSELIRADHISDRLASGERQKLTNLGQLVELLNRYETANRASIEDVAGYLHKRLCTGGVSEEEDEDSRLDNDSSDSVKILTLHTSKGLEFNIVFSPDIMTSGGTGSDRFALYHSEEDFGQYLSLSPNEVSAAVKKEDLAENMRLLYVLTTRARFLTLLYFQKTASRGRQTLLNEIVKSDEIKRFCDQSEGTIRYRTVSQATPLPPSGSFTIDWEEEQLGRRVPCRSISSFTGISASSSAEKDESTSSFVADDDKNQEERKDEQQSKKIKSNEAVTLNFPSGRDAGTLLHSIFEKIDFGASDEERDRVVGELLNENSALFKNREDLGAVFDSVRANVKTVCEKQIFGGFSLSQLDRERDTLSECEFYCRVEGADLAKLCSIIRQNEKLELAPLKNSIDGFVVGYIDLVLRAGGKYYLVDWKSNNLDSRPNDSGNLLDNYAREGLEAEMKNHNYFLQFFLYLAALDLYLSKADPGYSYEKSFGEVVYIFLRGVSDAPGSETGLYWYRPQHATIKAIQRLLAGSKKEENG